MRQQFTQKERDTEIGLDYFYARYYSPVQGRFISPDEPFADQSPESAQSWNLYSYVQNNPLSFTDPTGRSMDGVVEKFRNWRNGFGWRTNEEVEKETRSRRCLIEHFTDQTVTPGQIRLRNNITGEVTLVSVGQLTPAQVWEIYDRLQRGVYESIDVQVPEPPINLPSLRYEASPKHTQKARGNIGAAPKNGQAALDESVQVKPTSPRRVGVDRNANEFVVFDETHPGKSVFHGHVRTWQQLTPEMKNALIKAGKVTKSGKIK